MQSGKLIAESSQDYITTSAAIQGQIRSNYQLSIDPIPVSACASGFHKLPLPCLFS
jgi:hypothetical protein